MVLYWEIPKPQVDQVTGRGSLRTTFWYLYIHSANIEVDEYIEKDESCH